MEDFIIFNKKYSIFLLLILIIGIVGISSVSAEDIADISEVNDVDEVDVVDYQNATDASIDTAVEDDSGLEKQLSESRLLDDERKNVSYEINIPDSVRTGGDGEDEDYSVCYEFSDYDVDGNFSILIDNHEVYNHPIWGYWDDDEHYFALNNLDIGYGNHTIEVKFDGNEKYAPFSVKKVFEYYYFKIHIPENIIKGDPDHIHCSMICEFALDAKGNLTVYIDNKRAFKGSVYKARYDEEMDELYSHIDIPLSSLSFGKHNYTVNYTGGNYDDIFLTGSFNISDYYFEVNYDYDDDLTYGENFNCEIGLIEGTTRNMILNLNGKNQTIVISGNDYSYYSEGHEFSNLVMGENNFTFSYEDKNLPKKTISFVINVTGRISSPYYKELAYNYDGNNVTLLLPSDAKGNLSVYHADQFWDYEIGEYYYISNDLIKTAPLENGFVSISLSDLSLGRYEILIKYEGDDYQVEDFFTCVTIVPNIICPAGIYSKNVTKYKVSVESPSDCDGKLTIDVYNVKEVYDEDLEEYVYKPTTLVSEIYNGSAEGKVAVNCPDLTVGNYCLVVKLFNGTKQTFSKNISFTVRNSSPDWVMVVDIPKEIALNRYWDYEHRIYYYPKNVPKDIESGTLSLYIDGVRKSSSSLDPEDYDYFEYDFFTLSVGTHKWEIRYTGDSFYNPSILNGTFKVVKKISTYVYGYIVTTTYKTSKKMTITLYDEDDKPVANRKISIKLNGKNYSAKTNKNGLASFTVPNNLAPKTYYATLKFAGDSSYFASSYSVKVVVKKATPKLTAKAKTFKVKAKKKYTATLKTDKNVVMKNVKVSITVGKKTYSAKTNSKGVVTLTLSKLSKKGKYTATVKFAGSAYYNAVSRKVKITVK